VVVKTSVKTPVETPVKDDQLKYGGPHKGVHWEIVK
jgi:hypothetical protein